jgi:glyoxylase-like metal-dependent hydrolase (beta-lactamase superfamily II)
VRALGLHSDVIVAISRVWQTTCTIVRGPGGRDGEAFVIDSPVYPDELEVLPSLLEQARFSFSGLLVTHGDWDHLLGRLAFPDAAIGCSEATADRLAAEPGAAQRELRAFDESHYVRRERPLALGAIQALPVPGYCAVGEAELELHPTAGHTPDGMALWAPWAGVLACGDYLSPVELPTLGEGGALDAYAETLARLEPLVRGAAHVVPGHGAPMTGERALAVLEQDVAYLQAVAADPETARPPEGRRDRHQRRLHAENVARVSRSSKP